MTRRRLFRFISVVGLMVVFPSVARAGVNTTLIGTWRLTSMTVDNRARVARGQLVLAQGGVYRDGKVAGTWSTTGRTLSIQFKNTNTTYSWWIANGKLTLRWSNSTAAFAWTYVRVSRPFEKRTLLPAAPPVAPPTIVKRAPNQPSREDALKAKKRLVRLLTRHFTKRGHYFGLRKRGRRATKTAQELRYSLAVEEAQGRKLLPRVPADCLLGFRHERQEDTISVTHYIRNGVTERTRRSRKTRPARVTITAIDLRAGRLKVEWLRWDTTTHSLRLTGKPNQMRHRPRPPKGYKHTSSSKFSFSIKTRPTVSTLAERQRALDVLWKYCSPK